MQIFYVNFVNFLAESLVNGFNWVIIVMIVIIKNAERRSEINSVIPQFLVVNASLFNNYRSYIVLIASWLLKVLEHL